MSNNLATLLLRLTGDPSQLKAAMGQAKTSVSTFSTGAKKELEGLRNVMNSVQGKLVSLGISTGAVMAAAQSARMDKGLTQIGQTAGATRAQVEGLRKDLFRMAGETGQSVEDLQQGFNNAVQSGLNFKEALPVLDATNKAMAVTGANANQLTSGLTVAATAFKFDLAKPNQALTLLDKMTAAGRLGNAELSNLSDIFSRVGVNASRAGMGFDQTLAFIEGLSLLEKQPERLATLADSTLRLFTNLKYAAKAQKTTGVKFFDESGSRRDPLKILADIKQKYDLLKTDKQRELFLFKAFEGADLDTIKGLSALLGGDMLSKIGKFQKDLGSAGGTINKDLPEAINNAVDQTGRLKAELRKAAEDFTRPLNAGVSAVIKKLLDGKDKGGMGYTGADLGTGMMAGVLGGYAAYRVGGPLAKKLMSRFGGTAAGIAEGKAVEAAAGVTPVFVVNWPAGGLGGAAGAAGAAAKTAGDIIGKSGAAGKLLPLLSRFGPAGLAVGATAAAGYGVGSGINGILNSGVSAVTGGKNDSLGSWLYDFLHKSENQQNNVTLNISIDEAGRAFVQDGENSQTNINVKRGTL